MGGGVGKGVRIIGERFKGKVGVVEVVVEVGVVLGQVFVVGMLGVVGLAGVVGVEIVGESGRWMG